MIHSNGSKYVGEFLSCYLEEVLVGLADGRGEGLRHRVPKMLARGSLEELVVPSLHTYSLQ